MKVLVVAAPRTGDVLPLAPLVDALRAAGHQVRVATAGPGAPVPALTPGARSRWRRPPLAVHGPRGTGAGRVEEVVETALAWRPDLVVHEPVAAAGAVAAARLGVPAVLQETGVSDGPRLLAATLASPELRTWLHQNGVDVPPPPALVLTVAPPSVVGHRDGLPMRAVPLDTGRTAPEWLRRPCYRPRIIVSRSTAADTRHGDPGPASAAAAEALDAEVVLVRARGRTAHRGLSGSVRRTGWVPLAEVLPHATALVHQGGAGGVLGALAVGLPQLVVPGAGHRPDNAAMVVARGVGLAVPVRAITTELLSHLVRDPELRRAAQEVQREMAGMPAPAEVVPALVELVGRDRRT